MLFLLDEFDELVELAGREDDGMRGLRRRKVEGNGVDGRSFATGLRRSLFQRKFVEDDGIDLDGLVDSDQLV